jgi:signal transduction histidine kinase
MSDTTDTRPGFAQRIADIGAPADEDDSGRIARRTLVLGGVLMSGGGVLWGTLALLFGRILAASIPIGYVVLTALNLLVFSRTKNFRRARFVQVFISLLLPFVFQWALGGFLASGAVMLWSMVSIVGALTFSDAREGGLWLVMYCALTLVSGGIDSHLSAHVEFTTSDPTRIRFLVLNLVVVSAIVFGLAIFLNTMRSRAVRSLEEASRRNVALNENLAREVEARGAQLEELRALQVTLHARSEELSASLEQLRTAQAELVQREKLAALGQLVAGVAHEVNTPLGVVYTAVTLSKDRIDALERSLTEGTLSRRHVLDVAKSTQEALRVATTNAERAAKLIADFKRIAVDQTSEAEESIELRGYLAALVQSLSPMLSRAKVSVELAGEEVSLTTRPGIIAQIVTNLIQNAVMHAYPEGTGVRRIELRCQREATMAVIDVEDFGVGMDEKTARRVFEPFFTTKRGAGGSGLGMHIVHEQVYGALGGSVQLDTREGRGTRVTLRVPLLAPRQRTSASEEQRPDAKTELSRSTVTPNA